MSPSSSYGDTIISDALPWKRLYDTVFSSYFLAALLLMSCLAFLPQFDPVEMRRCVAMLLPLMYIVLVSVVCEKGENMRFKFFVEPAAYVFIVRALSPYVQRLAGSVKRQVV
jgi:hypothetical protein